MHMLVKLNQCPGAIRKVHLRNSQPSHYYECMIGDQLALFQEKTPFPSGH